MKTLLLLGALILHAGLLAAADSTPQDEISAAAKKLGDSPNYSWKTTIAVPEDAPFHPGPTEGKSEKDGFTQLKLSFFDNTIEVFLKGDKGAINGPEPGWRSLAEMEKEAGPGQFIAVVVRKIKVPAAEAAQLNSYCKGLKKEGDTYSGDLSEEGAKELLTFRPPGGGEGPAVKNPKGSVKFWVKDGVLTRYEFKLRATVSFGGNEFDNNTTTTVEVKDVGTTKIQVPEEAKKKLS